MEYFEELNNLLPWRLNIQITYYIDIDRYLNLLKKTIGFSLTIPMIALFVMGRLALYALVFTSVRKSSYIKKSIRTFPYLAGNAGKKDK